MKSVGYPDYKAGAVEVAASTNGQLMPPIMGAAAFIIAEYCNLEYFQVVKAAFIPAIISYIALIYITHLEASKLGLKGVAKAQLPQFFKTLLGGLHFLIPLFYLIYELMILRHTPQLAAYRAIEVLAVLIVVQNLIRAYIAKESLWGAFKLSLRQLWDALVAGGRNMMGIGVAVSTAGIIVGVVAMGLGGLIVEVIDTIAGGNLMFLLVITAIASLILGMGLPTTANYIVMASLTVPVIIQLGEDYGLVIPVIAAHLFCFFFGILADDTPPVGLAAYAASAIAKSDPIRTGIQGFTYDIRTALLPFMFVFNTDLLLIGITSLWHIATIFITGVLAMFAFAALTQNWFIVRNRIYESVLLAGVTLILFRPNMFINYLHFGNKMTWYVIGAALFGFIYLIQWPRARAAARQAA
jgi:TRAP transporter 4TM/12TM fusion protein